MPQSRPLKHPQDPFGPSIAGKQARRAEKRPRRNHENSKRPDDGSHDSSAQKGYPLLWVWWLAGDGQRQDRVLRMPNERMGYKLMKQVADAAACLKDSWTLKEEEHDDLVHIVNTKQDLLYLADDLHRYVARGQKIRSDMANSAARLLVQVGLLRVKTRSQATEPAPLDRLTKGRGNLELADRIYDAICPLEDPVPHAWIKGHLSALYRRIGKYHEALRKADEGLELLCVDQQDDRTSPVDPARYSWLLNIKAAGLQVLGEYEAAEVFSKDAIDLAKRIADGYDPRAG